MWPLDPRNRRLCSAVRTLPRGRSATDLPRPEHRQAVDGRSCHAELSWRASSSDFSAQWVGLSSTDSPSSACCGSASTSCAASEFRLYVIAEVEAETEAVHADMLALPGCRAPSRAENKRTKGRRPRSLEPRLWGSGCPGCATSYRLPPCMSWPAGSWPDPGSAIASRWPRPELDRGEATDGLTCAGQWIRIAAGVSSVSTRTTTSFVGLR